MGNYPGHYLHAYQGDFITAAPGQTPPVCFFYYPKLRRIFMSDIEYLKDINDLVKLPRFSVENEKVAKMRERQRRERKEKLYSYSPKNSLIQ